MFVIGHDLEKNRRFIQKYRKKNNKYRNIKKKADKHFQENFLNLVTEKTFGLMSFFVSGKNEEEKKQNALLTNKILHDKLISFDTSKFL